MIYLLAKYALVFILAAFGGFVLGRWMTRRKFVDVTESYEDLRIALDNSDATQWDTLWSRLDALPQPREVSLTSVNERLDGLAYAIAKLPGTPSINLAPIEGNLGVVSELVSSLPTQADISNLSDKLNRIDEAVRQAPVVDPQAPVDLAPINRRLGAIESGLKALSDCPTTSPSPQTLPARVASANTATLKEASFGKKDNLKRISGVGPKLERLLNTNGIFYFWQITNWTASDIETIDERLDTFKGRIGRDKWVSQADRFHHEPGSAQQPTEMRISA